MLCEKCKKNEATFYYKQNINGHVTELHLCPDCAAEYAGTYQSPDVFGINLLEGLFSPVSSHIPVSERKRCTLCGSTLDEIIDTGRVGCAKCYEVFAPELEDTITSIHGNVRHIGRGKGNFTEKRRMADKLKELKKQLKKAVSDEDYEQAAVIRDKIREEESKEGE